MSKPEYHVQFDSLETKDLAVHASAQFEEPNPLITIDFQDGGMGRVAGSFTVDPTTLDVIVKMLGEVSQQTREKSGAYWRRMSP